MLESGFHNTIKNTIKKELSSLHEVDEGIYGFKFTSPADCHVFCNSMLFHFLLSTAFKASVD